MFEFPQSHNNKLSLGSVSRILSVGLTTKYGVSPIDSAKLYAAASDVADAVREIKERGDTIWDSETEREVVGFTVVAFPAKKTVEVSARYQSPKMDYELLAG